MPYYFVAKSPNGQLVGQYELKDIHTLVRSGEISLDDTATESIGTYAEVVRHGNAKWMTVAVLLAEFAPLATDQTPSTLPLPPPQPSLNKEQRFTRIATGFTAGAFFWVMPFMPFLSSGYDGIPWLIFACFGLPVVSAILAIIRATRPFGLGLFLACGLGWLILLSICGGLWR